MTKPYWGITSTNPITGESTYVHGCQQDTCNNPATVQWQRHATDEEISGFVDTIGQDAATTVTMAVFSCDTHAAAPAQAGIIHAVNCPAPGGCDCA